MLIKLPNRKEVNVHRSLLIPLLEIKLKIIKDTELACLQKAVDLWGENQIMTSRALCPLDMGYENNKFIETSNPSINQWNMVSSGYFTVQCASIIGIYGLKLTSDMEALPISGIRIDVIGSRVVQWVTRPSIYPLELARQLTQEDDDLITSFCDSLVFISENVVVRIYEYTQIANVMYYPEWLGVVVEINGVTLKI